MLHTMKSIQFSTQNLKIVHQFKQCIHKILNYPLNDFLKLFEDEITLLN